MSLDTRKLNLHIYKNLASTNFVKLSIHHLYHVKLCMLKFNKIGLIKIGAVVWEELHGQNCLPET